MTADTTMTLMDWKQQGEYFQYQQHRVFFRDSKSQSNEVLVLIHGFPTSSWDWYAVWPELAKYYRLITLDLLGYGWSDKPSRHDYSILEQADIVEALLAELSIKKARIVAHDYGDTVTQELMARRQHNEQTHSFDITSVVLTNGGLFPEVHRPRFIQKLLASPLGWLVTRLQNRRQFGKSFAPIFGPNTQPSEQELDEFWSLIHYNGGAYRFNKLICYLKERVMYRERWVGALVAPPYPVRFINGLVDPISGEHMVERYCELVEKPDVVKLPEIGHYPQVEAPEQVLNAILQFHGIT